MNAKISVFVICVEAITYFLLHNLHDCTFSSVPVIPFSFTKYHKTIWNTAVDLLFFINPLSNWFSSLAFPMKKHLYFLLTDIIIDVDLCDITESRLTEKFLCHLW